MPILGPGDGFYFLLRFIRQVRGLLLQLFAFLFNFIQATGVFLLNAILAVGAFLVRALGVIARGLRIFWDRFLRRLPELLRGLVKRLRDLAQKHIPRLIKIVQRIRRILDQYYERWVRPAIVAIERIRRVFKVLRLFGVKWAEKIDRKLFELERRIFQGWFLLVRRLNQVSTFLSILLTPELILQGRVLLGSVGKWVGGVMALLVNAGILPDQDLRSAALAARFPVPNFAQILGDFRSGRTLRSSEVEGGISTFRERVERGTAA